MQKPSPCHWRYDEPTDSWDTECEAKFPFTGDSPGESGFKFCPYCGGELREWKRCNRRKAMEKTNAK